MRSDRRLGQFQVPGYLRNRPPTASAELDHLRLELGSERPPAPSLPLRLLHMNILLWLGPPYRGCPSHRGKATLNVDTEGDIRIHAQLGGMMQEDSGSPGGPTPRRRRIERRPLLLSLEEADGLGSSAVWVDTRPGPDYRRGHIPGAIHFDNFAHANERTSLADLPELAALWMGMFGPVGITLDAPVVFYDAGTENRAPRPAFMLRALGNANSHVLHGGMHAWREAGRPVSKVGAEHPATGADVTSRTLDRTWVAGVDDVVEALERESAALVDVRDRAEYMGRRRLQWNPRLGRLRGAVPLEWTSLLERDPSTSESIRFKPDAELRQRLDEAGLAPDRPLIIYCQKSHRACNSYLAFERLGFKDVRVYVGSFREWSRRRDLPVEMPSDRAGDHGR